MIASRDSEILFLDVRNLLHSCSQSCPFHQRLIQNFVTILSRKNLMLTKKIEHMSRRSLRDKLLSYLSDESIRQRSTSFDLPFNRQQLADYLCVDRSALSRELSLLQEEGILKFRRNHFELTESASGQESVLMYHWSVFENCFL